MVAETGTSDTPRPTETVLGELFHTPFRADGEPERLALKG